MFLSLCICILSIFLYASSSIEIGMLYDHICILCFLFTVASYALVCASKLVSFVHLLDYLCLCCQVFLSLHVCFTSSHDILVFLYVYMCYIRGKIIFAHLYLCLFMKKGLNICLS